MKPDTQSQINVLESAYTKLTGRQFRASGIITGREQGWCAFINAGYGPRELEEVILWIKRGIKDGIRFEAALSWRNLVGDLGRFEDDYQTMLAEKRNAKPAPSPKQQVLREAHTSERTTKPAPEMTKHVAPIVEHWIAKMREAAQ